MRRLIYTAVFCLLSSSALAAEPVSDSVKLVRAMGGAEYARIVASELIQEYSRILTDPQYPASDAQRKRGKEVLFETMRKHLEMGSFETMLAEKYEMFFSPEEISRLERFYSSELGVKMLRVMPSIDQQAPEVLAQWSRFVNSSIQSQLQQNGVPVK